MKSPGFEAYIEAAIPLGPEDYKLERAVYYGEVPVGVETAGRLNFDPIVVEDSYGLATYSLLITGALETADRILIRSMPWSDHPGRGFEALRENLVADSKNGVAVVGVSFPGAGLNSEPMTDNQAKSLSRNNGDFSFIAAQQWQAITEALTREQARLGSGRTIYDYEYVIGSNSQGTSNTVGLVQTVPQGIRVAGVGLAQGVGLWERQPLVGYTRLGLEYSLEGKKHVNDYLAANTYGPAGYEYPVLGPNHNYQKNALERPASHLFQVILAMGRGGDTNRLIRAMHEREITDAAVMMNTGSEDKIATPKDTDTAYAAIDRSGIAVGDLDIWQGHYHPLMENLTNARFILSKFATVDKEPPAVD